jgi:hypothetical protein
MKHRACAVEVGTGFLFFGEATGDQQSATRRQ